ncbi:hypothetical protein D3C87_325220 [compost metagenome]
MTKQYALKNDDQYAARFLHFRSTSWDRMSKKRTHDNKVDTSYGGFTVAYNPLLIIRKDGTIGVCVEVGTSRCSGLDRYVKAKGREIALKNLESPSTRNYAMIYLGEGEYMNTLSDKIPVIFNATGELYIDERVYNLRAAVADSLGFSGY